MSRSAVDSREIIRRLLSEWWHLVRTKGSHHQYRNPSKPGLVTLPDPTRDLPIGTVRSNDNQAG